MPAIGIESWGAWLPYYRLTGELTGKVFHTASRASRSLASFDEDAVTMAVEAVRRLGTTADALYFASVSAPYAEKQHAAIVCTAADWPTEVHTADWSGSLRAATSAIIAATDAVTAGRVKSIVIIASERRPFEAGTPAELAVGDAAVALRIGSAPAFAFCGAFSFVQEIMDAWRRDGDATVRETDAKFVETQSYTPFQPQALHHGLRRLGWSLGDLARVYFWAPDARVFNAIGRAAGLKPPQLPADTLFNRLGSLGNVHALALLLADLPNLRPGDRIAILGHGSGADATFWQVTEELTCRNSVAWREAERHATVWPNYGAHLRARRLIATESLDPFTAPPVLYREETALLRRHAAVCVQCKTLHYPPQPVCRACAGTQFTPQRLGDTGSVFTLTADHLYPSPLPPTIMASVDVDGGGRFYGQATDCRPDEIAIGSRVEFTFRRLHEGSGFVNYFWKVRPQRSDGG